MHDIDAILEKMREAIPAGPVRIKEAVEGGRKVVGCYCAYTPYEVIRAAGAIPATLCATSEKPIAAAEEHLPRNLCPLIKAGLRGGEGDEWGGGLGRNRRGFCGGGRGFWRCGRRRKSGR